jgi:chromosomal replication initiator protein
MSSKPVDRKSNDRQLTLEESDDLIRLRAAWEVCLRRLKVDMPSAWFERFLVPLSPRSMVGDEATFACPSRFTYAWINERYLETIQRMLSDEIGRPVTVNILVEGQSKPTGQAAVAAPSTPVATPSFRLVEKYQFEKFIVGQSNRLAFAGAKAVAAEPGTKFNPLFIYSRPGLGKTHLLHAIAREILSRNPRTPIVYCTAQQFAEEFINALQNNRLDAFRRAQRNIDVWLVDDIQFIANKDKTQEEIFHTFNHLQQFGKQIVLCSDRPPRDLRVMDERLRSRFECGLVADIQMPDTETRCAILRSKAEQEKVDLSLNVAMYMAESVPGNIRILEGALTKVAAQASVEGRPIDLDLARQVVEDYYKAHAVIKPGHEEIVVEVAKHFRLSKEDLIGSSRKAPIVHARHIAVFVAREITGDSWNHLGSFFGDRDHSSMIHGYDRIQSMINDDKDLRATVKMLIRNLYPME